MTDTLSIDPKSTALLVMDFQKTIVDNYSSDSEALLSRTAGLIAAARNSGVMVVYVVVGFRPGYPEVSERNKLFGAIRQSGRFAAGDDSAGIHPDVAPAPGEVVVTKHRVGAFTSTELDMVLRANGLDTLMLAGIATSGVVLSTLRHAADADYRLVVVKDCCADGDAEVHRVLTEKVFPRQAEVVASETVMAAL